MALEDQIAKAMRYWGVIMRGVYTRVSTSELWAAIRENSGTQPGESLGFGAAAVSRLRGIAARIRDFAARVMGTSSGGYIDWTNVPVAPWARPPDERALNPQYAIRVYGDWLGPTGIDTGWRMITLSGSLPNRMNDLIDTLRQASVQNVSSGAWANTPNVLEKVHQLEIMAV